jgi:hypothetical protein
MDLLIKTKQVLDTAANPLKRIKTSTNNVYYNDPKSVDTNTEQMVLGDDALVNCEDVYSNASSNVDNYQDNNYIICKNLTYPFILEPVNIFSGGGKVSLAEALTHTSSSAFFNVSAENVALSIDTNHVALASDQNSSFIYHHNLTEEKDDNLFHNEDGELEFTLSTVVIPTTGIGLYILSLLTFVGNAMVLHAIRTDKRLQTVSIKKNIKNCINV